MISECIAAYNQIDGKRFLLKNRDKPYNPEICVHHEMIDGTEVMYYTDVAANHAEGLNQHGIGIAYTTSNFQKDQADGFTKNIDIIKSALALSDPKKIIDKLSKQDGGVKGIIFLSTPQGSYQIENKADAGPEKMMKKLSGGKSWMVMTNHPGMLQGAISEKDGEDYISSKIRLALAQAALHGVRDLEKAHQSLSYKYFSDNSHHNMLRDSDFEQTVMQVGMDLGDRSLYLTPVPGKVKKITKKTSLPDGYEPVCKYFKRDYKEPTLAPFKLYTTNIDESITKFNLISYLTDDGPESDPARLDKRCRDDVEKKSKIKLAQAAADNLWEKERILVSLFRKIQKDPVYFTAGHTSSQVQKELDVLQGMIDKIGDDYKKLLDIIHMERYGEHMPNLYEASKRKPRKKGQRRNIPSHSDIYTDENPKGTIHGLKFATVKDAKASVSKIRGSGKSHAHKIQAAVAMEQRAKAAGKKSAAGVYRTYINSMKKKKNESIIREYIQQIIHSD